MPSIVQPNLKVVTTQAEPEKKKRKRNALPHPLYRRKQTALPVAIVDLNLPRSERLTLPFSDQDALAASHSLASCFARASLTMSKPASQSPGRSVLPAQPYQIAPSPLPSPSCCLQFTHIAVDSKWASLSLSPAQTRRR
ncbi:hypothetical protein M0R45_026208 [Rubus argutus]|uniref:Uncharacterized protein n=1 Tax=Rubus argutus TaxID=59490 RepID=A0AAW1WZ60_RUBAR